MIQCIYKVKETKGKVKVLKMKTRILDKIEFNYELAKNPKSKRFTSNHDIYDCVIKYNGKKYNFEFQTNTSAVGEPKLSEVVECLVSDMGFYEQSRDILDFAYELGYEPKSTECRKAWDGCKRTAKAFHRLFNDEELGMIDDDLFYNC